MLSHSFSFPDPELNNKTDYNKVFEPFIGKIFAKVMEECFFMNPIHEREDELYGCIPLDDVMSIHDYLSAVLIVYSVARSEFPKSSLTSHFKIKNRNNKYPDNYVIREPINNKQAIRFINIDSDVMSAMIWGAYFYAYLKAIAWDKEKKTRDILYNYLLNHLGLPRDVFEEKHVLAQLFKQYNKSTIKEIYQSMNPADYPRMESLNHDLDYYIAHRVYGLGYNSIDEYLRILSIHKGLNITDDDYLKVFREAENCVERVMSSKFPEREIPRIHSYIFEKYAKVQTKTGNVIVENVTVEYCIGCLIELLFMVALCELMPERTDRVNRTLVDMRSFIERHDNFHIYENYEIWKLVAERIPSKPGLPRIEDLQVEIERLKENNTSNISKEEVERLKKENAQLKKEIEGYKELIHSSVPEKYKDSLESVFLISCKDGEEEFLTYPLIREAGKMCLDPNEPTLVPLFMKACITKKYSRESALKFPRKIVEALIAIGALNISEDKIKGFTDSVGRKIKRMSDEKMTTQDEEYYSKVCGYLSRSIFD